MNYIKPAIASERLLKQEQYDFQQWDKVIYWLKLGFLSTISRT
jgi:hypothetical protein